MQLTKKLRIFDKLIIVKIQTMKIPITATAGIAARVCYTTEYVTMLDYDNITDDRLTEELLYLQECYGLGDFHIFKTNDFGRHVICIDRLPLREAIEVVYNSTCDDVFKKGIRINEYRTWILRALEKGQREKPQYLYTIKSDYNGKRLQSLVHGLFLQIYYNAEVRLTNTDDNYDLEVQGYKTSNKITLKKQ